MQRAALIAAWIALAAGARAAPGDAWTLPCDLVPGRTTHALEVPLAEVRHYAVRVGAKAVAPAPLLIAFHAWGGRETGIEERLAPDVHWPEAVLVAPLGLPRILPEAGSRSRAGWQLAPGEYDDRDIAFFDALLEEVALSFCVDRDHVVLAGYSNGGAFASLLACLRPDVIAGVAVVGSSGPPEDLSCAGPVPALVQHGRDDRVIPLLSGLETFAHWSRYNACRAPPAELPRGCVDAVGCTRPTRFCLTLSGRGWPSGTSGRVVGFLREQRRARAGGDPPTDGDLATPVRRGAREVRPAPAP